MRGRLTRPRTGDRLRSPGPVYDGGRRAAEACRRHDGKQSHAATAADVAALQGVWVLVDGWASSDEQSMIPGWRGKLHYVFEGDRFDQSIIMDGNEVIDGGFDRFTVDASKSPKTIELARPYRPHQFDGWSGTYRLAGDRLEVRPPDGKDDGPLDQSRPAGQDQWRAWFVLKKVATADGPALTRRFRAASPPARRTAGVPVAPGPVDPVDGRDQPGQRPAELRLGPELVPLLRVRPRLPEPAQAGEEQGCRGNRHSLERYRPRPDPGEVVSGCRERAAGHRRLNELRSVDNQPEIRHH